MTNGNSNQPKIATASPCSPGNIRNGTTPINAAITSVTKGLGPIGSPHMRHFPRRSRKENIGTRSYPAISVAQLSQRERPAITLSPLGHREHKAPTKLPQMVPSAKISSNRNQSGSVPKKIPILSPATLRACPSGPSGNHQPRYGIPPASATPLVRSGHPPEI